MPFRPVTPEKLSSAVVRQVEELILRGILQPGARLPSERELAERLGVSRPSLRDAIAQLQEAGLLSTKAGAGVFVADVLGSAFSPALTALFARHADGLISKNVIDFNTLEDMSSTLRRMERYWTDQIRYIY